MIKYNDTERHLTHSLGPQKTNIINTLIHYQKSTY